MKSIYRMGKNERENIKVVIKEVVTIKGSLVLMWQLVRHLLGRWHHFIQIGCLNDH